MTFEFTVPGPPKGKGRPRFVRMGKHVSTYTPKETREYEKKVKDSFKEKYKGKKLVGAIKAEICAIFEPPKSASKKVRGQMLNGEIPYTKKPDADNMKSIADGLNEIAYEDDSAIDDFHVTKMYGEPARVEVRLTDEKHVIQPIFFKEK